jgi:fused signal recognition particle receptor
MLVLLILLTIAVAVGAYVFLRGRQTESSQLPARGKIAESGRSVSPQQLGKQGGKSEPQLKGSDSKQIDPLESARVGESATSPQAADAKSDRAAAPITAKPEQAQDRQPTPIHDVVGLRRGLERSRRADGFFGRIAALLRGKKELNADIAEQIEEVLLTSDVGVQTTQIITERIRESLTRQQLSDPEVVWESLRAEARRILGASAQRNSISLRAKPTVILLVGVNGAGKTTTIGKLATRFKAQGRTVLLAAGDTFRAAAVQQLGVWGDRIGVEVVRGKDGADPGSVIFEAVRKAQELNIDVVLADTAGRLHTKANLMAELKKVVKTTAKALEGAPHEVLLVVDATNGQNAVAQAHEFCQELPVTGMVLTKLDGTAKGGFVVGIAAALQLPVKLIGLGEKATDLHDFDADDFVEALLGNGPESLSTS